MDEVKRNILNLLEGGREMFSLEIAKSLGLSPPTAAKYLEILKAEGKVISYNRLPYKYWKKVVADK